MDLERVLAELLAVLRFADNGEADFEEESFGAVIALFPNCSDAVEAATACFLGKRFDGETADAHSLSVSGDADAPDAAAKFFLRSVRIKVATDEANNLVSVKYNAWPRRRGSMKASAIAYEGGVTNCS